MYCIIIETLLILINLFIIFIATQQAHSIDSTYAFTPVDRDGSSDLGKCHVR